MATKTASRRREASWPTTNPGMDEGTVRRVLLAAYHIHGEYRVTAMIDSLGEGWTSFTIFEDPATNFVREKGRFSQKHLKDLFEQVLEDFDHEAYYASHEIPQYVTSKEK